MLEGRVVFGEFLIFGIISGLIVAVVLSPITWVVVRVVGIFSERMVGQAGRSAKIMGALSFSIIFCLWMLGFYLSSGS